MKGIKFGRLTVLSFHGKAKDRHSLWNCKCSCGRSKVVSQNHLKGGKTKSCGCLRIDTITRHGESVRGHWTVEFRAWRGIIDRCYSKRPIYVKYYSKRGISVHDPWRKSYKNFLDYLLTTIGRRPTKKHSLDRINNDGNYIPGNIRWATKHQQSANRRVCRKDPKWNQNASGSIRAGTAAISLG